MGAQAVSHGGGGRRWPTAWAVGKNAPSPQASSGTPSGATEFGPKRIFFRRFAAPIANTATHGWRRVLPFYRGFAAICHRSQKLTCARARLLGAAPPTGNGPPWKNSCLFVSIRGSPCRYRHQSQPAKIPRSGDSQRPL